MDTSYWWVDWGCLASALGHRFGCPSNKISYGDGYGLVLDLSDSVFDAIQGCCRAMLYMYRDEGPGGFLPIWGQASDPLRV